MGIDTYGNFTGDAAVERIASRMDEMYHDAVVEAEEIIADTDELMIPVNLLATHHHYHDNLSRYDNFRCRLPLTYKKTGKKNIIPETGNCYGKTANPGCQSSQSCKTKCNSVLQFTKYCMEGGIGNQQSALFGFLMFVLEKASQMDNAKTAYKKMKNTTDLAAALLHLYGYVEGDEFIAFPVLIENDLNNLVGKLEACMADFCRENTEQSTQPNVKEQECRMFLEAKKAFKQEGHRAWKRAQWMFCELLIYLSSKRSSLSEEHIDLLDKAKRAWEDTLGSPEDWKRNNPIT